MQQNAQTEHSKSYEVLKPTQKQCLNHHLLHTVKQINGDIAFKQVHQKSFIIRFHSRAHIPQQYTQDSFAYILQGEVAVYKTLKAGQETIRAQQTSRKQHQQGKGIFITCHKSHQIFGLQQYPLNLSERLVFQASELTKVMVFPIQLSLTCFKRIFSMNMLQFRAQTLKKFDFFRGLQIEKLKKIALYSKRYQGQKGQRLVKEGGVLNNLVLVLAGQVLFMENGVQKKVYSNEEAIGLADILEESNHSSNFELVCLTQCELMLIPRIHIIKTYKLKYRLEEKETAQLKSRRGTEYDSEKPLYTSNQQKEHPLKYNERQFRFKSNNFQQNARESSESRHRPKTSTYRQTANNIKEVRYSTFYNQRGARNSTKRNFKTEVSQEISQNNYFSHKTQISGEFGAKNESRSLGELCLRKFLNRKERRQNCEIIKYLKSNAPQLKLNPSKQYAVVKPLHVSDSNYIRTWKRKLKKAYIKTGSKSRQEKQNEAKFALFFKEESQQQSQTK